MAWKNPSQLPKFLAIKNKYRELKQPYKDEIANLAEDKSRIWSESCPAKVLNFVGGYIQKANYVLFENKVSQSIIFLLCLIFALIFDLGWWPFILLFAFWILLTLIFDWLGRLLKSYILSQNKDSLLLLEKKTAEVTAKLNSVRRDYELEWRNSCEDHVGHPPDWSDRRAKVLARDGYKCTNCGYPDGFKRRSRELHVHHVIHVSDGGSNNLGNLVTLCHICHRNIDRHHGAVRKMNKPSKKRWW